MGLGQPGANMRGLSLACFALCAGLAFSQETTESSQGVEEVTSQVTTEEPEAAPTTTRAPPPPPSTPPSSSSRSTRSTMTAHTRLVTRQPTEPSSLRQETRKATLRASTDT